MSKLFYLCLIIGVVNAATFRGKLTKKPAHLAHKEGCYVKEVEDVIPLGSEVTPIGKQCVRISCGGNMLYYATCGVVFSDDPKCHRVEEDLRKPYPDCCPGYKCEPDNQV